MDPVLEERIASFETNIRKSDKLLAILVFVLIVLMLTDSFILPPRWTTEVLKDGHIEHTRTDVTDGYDTYLLISESGHHFLVPSRPYGIIGLGQTFLISRSRIFNRPLKIAWTEEDDKWYALNIGILNTISLITFAAFGFSFLAAAHFILRRNRPRRGITLRMYAGLGIAIILFLMYLIQPVA